MTRYLPIPDTVIPPPESRAIWRVDGLTIALFIVKGELYAIDDACPHAGASLANGTLDGRTVQCRSHGLRFDLLTGCMQSSRNFGVRAYGIELRDGQPHLVVHEADAATSSCQ
jgi:3-phenylpropionate/trans-cinnamate dioxygenase ferredoxin subunit